MACFTTSITRSYPLWTVSCHVSWFIAGITWAAAVASSRIFPLLRALTSYVTSLVTVIARRLICTLLTIFSDMTDVVTSITSVLVLFAFSGEMAKTVALVAFFTATIPASSSTAAPTITTLRAFTSKMPGPVTSITCNRIHRTKGTNAPGFTTPLALCT